MSIALDLRCLIVRVAITNAIYFLTWTGVGGWGCPISSIVIRMGTAYWQFKNKPPNSTSAVDTMVLRSILQTK